MPQIEFDGKGEPIPVFAIPPFGGEGNLPDTVVAFPQNGTFDTALYVALGFTHFEVACVGAAGGRGGDNLSWDDDISYGGAGGGGGLHRVSGLLADLPASCPVVIGQVGADGADVFYTLDNLSHAVYHAGTPGADGGASTFNGATCRASGGKGGQPTPAIPTGPVNVAPNTNPGGNGGQGGAGNRTVAGGGAVGAIFTARYAPDGFGGQYLAGWDLTEAPDGTWDGAVGQGGGGGAGGRWGWGTNPQTGQGQLQPFSRDASSGGQGSFSFGDPSVYGIRQFRSSVPVPHNADTALIVPGGGGSGRIAPSLLYGSRASGFSPNGAVAIRLSQILA